MAIVTLPRLINGWQSQVVKRGVVFSCPRDSMLRLAASDHDVLGGMLGRDDLLCAVEWYRDLKPQTPEAWLSADPGTNCVAYTATHAFRLSGGGYISNPGEHLYRFPLSRVDLGTGVANPLLLCVPFDGEIQQPKANYKGSGQGRVHAQGPYRLAVTWLEVRGGVLRIVLGSEDRASAIDFDLAEFKKD